MDQVSIVEKKGANYILFELKGTINSYTFSDFQVKVYEAVKHTNLVLDMFDVNALDSAGLGVIMGGFNDAQDNGNTLYIMRPSLATQKAIDSTGFTDTFSIIQSVTEVS